MKRTLSGAVKRFTCSVLARQGTHLVVLFIAPTAMNVHGVALPAGTVTFGHFWTDRPYNVYHWLARDSGATLGYYLNLSDETRITREATQDVLDWLDLTVDILVLPDQPPLVLDEDELPPDAPPALRARIENAQTAALRDLSQLIALLETDRLALWPTVAPAAGPPTPPPPGPLAP